MRKLIYSLAVVLIIQFALNIQNCLAKWEKVANVTGSNGTVSMLAAHGNILFAGTDNGVFISLDNGSSWAPAGLSDKYIHALQIIGNNIYAGTEYCGVYLSTNNGVNWTQTGLDGYSIRSLTSFQNIIIAGSINDGIFVSTNSGLIWTQSMLNLPATVRTLVTLGNKVYAGTYQWPDPGLVYLSTNEGTNWNEILILGVYNHAVNSLSTIGNIVFAGTDDGIYRSTNYGTNWTPIALDNRFVLAISTIGNNIIAGTYAQQDSGVYCSTNNGIYWFPINQGFDNGGGVIVKSFLIANNYVYAATNHSIWRRTLTEIITITGIQNINTEIPVKFSLLQNYPNPFNPTTNIRFNVAKPGNVKIIVYDNMGREVKTLVNESLKPGTYEVSWNASHFSSGVYYYRLITNNFSETKKMLMIK